VFIIFSIIHVFARTLSFFAFITLCRDRERRFLRLKSKLWLILKNDYIIMFNCFQSLFDDLFKFANRFFEMNVSFNRSFLHNSIIAERWSSFSINDQKISDEHRFEMKKFLISKIKIRFLRFSQFVTQISIWFLNDDCFNIWNFSCICFLIWSSIFLYLMIKSCNISRMKTNINFDEM
jgi:hypothetical protein